MSKQHITKQKRIAVMTSGGDAQGMNSAIRAIVRLGLHCCCEVLYIYEGYEGLINDNFVVANWESVSNILQTGGTIIGSARSKEFMTREGRLKAAENLIRRSVKGLICIGGDGSLAGLNTLHTEWNSHLTDLYAKGCIKTNNAEEYKITMVGLIGSIDNDFCLSEMTIGADSALHRVVEAIDAVVDTAQSHQRTFIIEVMGRHCGFLAITAALATEADFVFVPEWPPEDNWPDKMAEVLARNRKLGRRLSVVIVAEGATDRNGERITAEHVHDAVKSKLKHDVRVTKLGHVQRGGRASFLDRMLGTRMGAEAVATVMNMSLAGRAYVIGIEGNSLKRMNLKNAIEKNKEVAAAQARNDSDAVIGLRSKSFAEKVALWKSMCEPPQEAPEVYRRFAIMHVGAPAAGMNAVTHAFVRCALTKNCKVYAISDSFTGLERGHLQELTWLSVSGWVSKGGSMLGTRKEKPSEPYRIQHVLSSYNIDALVLVGGFEAFSSALLLGEYRRTVPALRIPIVIIPATISNNVPGTRVSLGSDTALNEICRLTDYIKQSAMGTKKRAFIVETMGGNCGYLAAMCALAGAADAVHIPEEPISEADVKLDLKDAESKVNNGVYKYLLIRAEGCELRSREVLKIFQMNRNLSTRMCVLGHVQQGGSPSVFDRQMGLRMGAKAFSNLYQYERLCEGPKGIMLLGLNGSNLTMESVFTLKDKSCFHHRIHLDTKWWRRLTQLAITLTSRTERAEDDSAEEETCSTAKSAVSHEDVKTDDGEN